MLTSSLVLFNINLTGYDVLRPEPPTVVGGELSYKIRQPKLFDSLHT